MMMTSDDDDKWWWWQAMMTRMVLSRPHEWSSVYAGDCQPCRWSSNCVMYSNNQGWIKAAIPDGWASREMITAISYLSAESSKEWYTFGCVVQDYFCYYDSLSVWWVFETRSWVSLRGTTLQRKLNLTQTKRHGSVAPGCEAHISYYSWMPYAHD